MHFFLFFPIFRLPLLHLILVPFFLQIASQLGAVIVKERTYEKDFNISFLNLVAAFVPSLNISMLHMSFL